MAGAAAVLTKFLDSGFKSPITGHIYWVKSTTAVDYATFYQTHFVKYANGNSSIYNTVQAAIDAAKANVGDVILVTEGYTETVTATSIAMNKAGVRVVCLGRGQSQPVFTYSATGSTITVSAASMSWEGGFHKPAAGIAVVSAFTIGAATDFLLQGATFEDASSTGAFTSLVTTGSTTLAANGLSIVGNYHLGLATAPAATISILGNTDRLYVADNHIDSAATNNIGHFITAAALVLRGARIVRNVLNVVSATDATVGIFLTSSASTDTGVVAYNLISSLDSTTALLMTASTGLRAFENYLATDANLSGALWPTVGDPS